MRNCFRLFMIYGMLSQLTAHAAAENCAKSELLTPSDSIQALINPMTELIIYKIDCRDLIEKYENQLSELSDHVNQTPFHYLNKERSGMEHKLEKIRSELMNSCSNTDRNLNSYENDCWEKFQYKNQKMRNKLSKVKAKGNSNPNFYSQYDKEMKVKKQIMKLEIKENLCFIKKLKNNYN